MLRNVVPLGVDDRRDEPVGVDLLGPGLEIIGERTALGSDPETLLAAHGVELRIPFAGFDEAVIDPAVAVAAIAVRRGGHHTPLVTGSDQNFRTALRSGQFEKFDLVVAKELRVIAVTAHFVLFFRRATAGNGQHSTRNHIIYQSFHNQMEFNHR